MALLLDTGEIMEAELVSASCGRGGRGLARRATGAPPDPQAVQRQLADPLRLPGVLGLSREGGDWRARTVTLTGVGRATALEALRARASGPRPDPFRG